MASIHHTILLGRCGGGAEVPPARIARLRQESLDALREFGLLEGDTCFDAKLDPSSNELCVFAKVIVPPSVLIRNDKYRQLHACLNEHDLTRRRAQQDSF